MHEWFICRHTSRGSFSVALAVAYTSCSRFLSLSLSLYAFSTFCFSLVIDTFIIITISGKSWSQTHEKESETLTGFPSNGFQSFQVPLMASIL
jgi:hypothetical protein